MIQENLICIPGSLRGFSVSSRDVTGEFSRIFKDLRSVTWNLKGFERVSGSFRRYFRGFPADFQGVDRFWDFGGYHVRI